MQYNQNSRPQQNQVHSFIVDRVEDKQKQFNSQQGMREKWMLYFNNGYKAEYCPLVGQFDQRVKQGSTLVFKIIHRKDWCDEIEPTVLPEIPKGIQSYHGHPASLALTVAKDVHVAKIGNQKSTAKATELVLSDMLADADTIYDWLVGKSKPD